MFKEYRNKHPFIFRLVVVILLASTLSIFAAVLSGPSNPTVNSVPKFTDSKLLASSGVTITAGNDMNGVNALTANQGNVTTVYVTNIYSMSGAVSLTSDNQAITITDYSSFTITSDNGTAGNRTFVLSTGVDGKIIYLLWTGTNAGELIDDSANFGSGNVRLSANWTPTQYDVLVLRAVGNDWYEVSRSTN